MPGGIPPPRVGGYLPDHRHFAGPGKPALRPAFTDALQYHKPQNSVNAKCYCRESRRVCWSSVSLTLAVKSRGEYGFCSTGSF
jgi:hypothetical protein